MILTNASGAGLTATQSEAAVRWRGLARRGMLYSECEAIDYLELAPHAVVTMRGRSGAEEVWYVLAGRVEFDGQEGGPLRAGCGDLVLRPASISSAVRNPSSQTPAGLLLIAAMPTAVTDRLPVRRGGLGQSGNGSGPHRGDST